jgi:hypothetical protein
MREQCRGLAQGSLRNAASFLGVGQVASQHARVGRTLDLLTQGLFPYVQQELRAAFGDDWEDAARSSFRNDRIAAVMMKLNPADWDAHALLTVMWDQWNSVFRQRLGLFERSLVSELREFRNRWAHQAMFEDDDAYRVVDSARRLLAAIGAPETLLTDLDHLKLDLLREKLDRQVDDDLRRSRAGRERSIEILLYAISGFAILASTLLALVPRNPLAGLLLMAFTMLTFGYLVFQRSRTPLVIHGVHECPTCRKIIYSEVCPYCAAPPTSSSIIKGNSGLRFPPFQDTERTTQQSV